MNELNRVAIRVFGKGDDCGAVLHRPRLTGHRTAVLPHSRAGEVDVLGAYGDVTKTVAEIIGVGVPVVGQLDGRRGVLVTVAEKGERKPPPG